MPAPVQEPDLDQSKLIPEERTPLRPNWVKYVEEAAQAEQPPEEEPPA